MVGLGLGNGALGTQSESMRLPLPAHGDDAAGPGEWLPPPPQHGEWHRRAVALNPVPVPPSVFFPGAVSCGKVPHIGTGILEGSTGWGGLPSDVQPLSTPTDRNLPRKRRNAPSVGSLSQSSRCRPTKKSVLTSGSDPPRSSP